MTEVPINELDIAFKYLENRIVMWANDKGFGITPETKFAEKAMLMVTELAEAVEGDRQGNPKSDKIPLFSSVEEELADCIIRILHWTGDQKLDVLGAILEKLDYNDGRPFKHGKAY